MAQAQDINEIKRYKSAKQEYGFSCILIAAYLGSVAVSRITEISSPQNIVIIVATVLGYFADRYFSKSMQ